MFVISGKHVTEAQVGFHGCRFLFSAQVIISWQWLPRHKSHSTRAGSCGWAQPAEAADCPRRRPQDEPRATPCAASPGVCRETGSQHPQESAGRPVLSAPHARVGTSAVCSPELGVRASHTVCQGAETPSDVSFVLLDPSEAGWGARRGKDTDTRLSDRCLTGTHTHTRLCHLSAQRSLTAKHPHDAFASTAQEFSRGGRSISLWQIFLRKPKLLLTTQLFFPSAISLSGHLCLSSTRSCASAEGITFWKEFIEISTDTGFTLAWQGLSKWHGGGDGPVL